MSGLGRCPDLRNPDLGGSTVLVNTLLNVIVKVNMRNIVVSMYSLRTQKRKFGINSGNANIFISSCNSQL